MLALRMMNPSAEINYTKLKEKGVARVDYELCTLSGCPRSGCTATTDASGCAVWWWCCRLSCCGRVIFFFCHRGRHPARI